MEIILTCLVFLFEIIFLILLTDFISGVIHWWEDTYGNPNWGFGIGKYLIIPNLIHHLKPRDFIRRPYYTRNFPAIIVSFLFSAIVYLICRDWRVAFFVFLYGSQSVEIHAINHRTDKENGKFLILLQRSGLIQSKRHHANHHIKPNDADFCLMTNWVNPILNKINFWQNLEVLVLVLLKIAPRNR